MPTKSNLIVNLYILKEHGYRYLKNHLYKINEIELKCVM